MNGLLRGVADDLAGYRALLLLQQEQFEAALRHRGARLTELAEQIIAALEALEVRRVQRVQQVGVLLGQAGTMQQAADLLKPAARERLQADWLELEHMVVECKRLNVRNGALLTDQYSIMQRVLQGEEHIYAPI